MFIICWWAGPSWVALCPARSGSHTYLPLVPAVHCRSGRRRCCAVLVGQVAVTGLCVSLSSRLAWSCSCGHSRVQEKRTHTGPLEVSVHSSTSLLPNSVNQNKARSKGYRVTLQGHICRRRKNCGFSFCLIFVCKYSTASFWWCFAAFVERIYPTLSWSGMFRPSIYKCSLCCVAFRSLLWDSSEAPIRPLTGTSMSLTLSSVLSFGLLYSG